MDNQTKKLLLLALSGDATAQNDLGCAYSSGQGVEQDFAEAIKWWRKAADCDLPGAALNLGLAYLSGQGVPQDYTEAARWNRKAAEQGLAGAEHNLGNAYFKGQGVPQNYTEAVKWYRRAAYQGLAASQYSLGLAYANGNGVGQDYLEAARWYLKSAEQGDVDAQYNLAGLYAQGLGVAQDLAEAEKWWIKAAAQGDDQAKKCLQALYSAAAGQRNANQSSATGQQADSGTNQNQSSAGASGTPAPSQGSQSHQYSDRIGRKKFWQLNIAAGLLPITIMPFIIPLGGLLKEVIPSGWVQVADAVVVTAAIVTVLDVLYIFVKLPKMIGDVWEKRAHDLGLNGNYAGEKACWAYSSLLGLFFCLIIFQCPETMLDNSLSTPLVVKIAGVTVLAVPAAYFWIKYGFVKGTDGDNQYGPDPTK